jgi:hypothetical protein
MKNAVSGCSFQYVALRKMRPTCSQERVTSNQQQENAFRIPQSAMYRVGCMAALNLKRFRAHIRIGNSP